MKKKCKGLLCLWLAAIMLLSVAMPAMAEEIAVPPQYKIAHQPTLAEPYVTVEEYKDGAYGVVTEETTIAYQWYHLNKETDEPDYELYGEETSELDLYYEYAFNDVVCKIIIGEEPDEVELVSDPITINKAYLYTGTTPLTIESPLTGEPFLIDYEKTLAETTAEMLSAPQGHTLDGWKLWEYTQISGSYYTAYADSEEQLNYNVPEKPANYTLTQADYDTYMGSAPSSSRGLAVEPMWLLKYRFSLDGEGNPIGQPTHENDYTVQTQEYHSESDTWSTVAPEDVTYKWYEWLENTYEVVDGTPGEGQLGIPPEYERLIEGIYEEGVWTSEYNRLSVALQAKAGDVVRIVAQSGTIDSISFESLSSDLDPNEDGSFTIPADGDYVIFTSSSAAFTAKITVERSETGTTKIADGATLSNATKDKFYACVATFTDAELTSNPVKYIKETSEENDGIPVRPRPTGSGGGASRYKVKFNSNGGSEVETQTILSGRKLEVPDVPKKEGYTFDAWYTSEALTEAYDFDAKVTKAFTLYAGWVKDTEEAPDDNPEEPEDPATGGCAGGLMCISRTFDDLDVSKWYHEDTDYVLENKLMMGVGPRLFAPSDVLTRAMLITILYRAEGEPATNRSIPFADVALDAYYANAASWAQQTGIVIGYNENTFVPDEIVTREQLATIMYRYAQYKGYDVSVGESTNILSYEDAADVSEWAITAMQYAVGSGLLQGKSETTLNPLDPVTRVELAAILHWFIEGNK